ncbi:MAG: hypothetical protein IJK52_10295 [Oscillospiraceae bacterium]|nr:hypothetical protein [Oscillospiraceae bacterium]
MFGMYGEELALWSGRLIWLAAAFLALSVLLWLVWGIYLNRHSLKERYGYDCRHPEKKPSEEIDPYAQPKKHPPSGARENDAESGASS